MKKNKINQKSSNHLFENFEYEKSQILVQRWQNKEAYEDYYNAIIDPTHKQVVFEQFKALMNINYYSHLKFIKRTKKRFFMSIKETYFYAFLINFLVSFIPALFIIIIVWFFPDTNVPLLVKILLIPIFSLLSLIFFIFGFFSWIRLRKKLNKKELKLIYCYPSIKKNHHFYFSNQKQLFELLKTKKAPYHLNLEWDDKDFMFFNILYSREIYNRINNCSFPWFMKGKISKLMYSFLEFSDNSQYSFLFNIVPNFKSYWFVNEGKIFNETHLIHPKKIHKRKWFHSSEIYYPLRSNRGNKKAMKSYRSLILVNLLWGIFPWLLAIFFLIFFIIFKTSFPH